MMSVKEKILKELEVFKNISFVDSTHSYYLNDKKFSKSVTGLIHEYSQPFDEQGMAEKVAAKEDKTVTEILDKWHYERDYACDKGNYVHDFIQDTFNGIERTTKHDEYQNSINQAYQFYQDYKDKLITIRDEIIVGDTDFDLCGSIDNMFYNTETQGIWLIDYKTNKEIKTKGFRGAKMKVPLEHLDDCNYNHYQLQLNIYKYILEKNTNLEVKEMKLIHFDEQASDYTIYEVNDLQKETKKILNLRRANKMAKMILIMGEQGSGKTTSLRNIPPKEHYYIDCDKKGLNYKGWRNDYNEENKNYKRTNEGEEIINLLKNISEKAPHIKYISIDTINSIMIADELSRSKQKGFDKWDDMANVILNIEFICPDLRDDLTVIFLGHTQTEDDGFTRLKTNGRKLNKIGVEGYFNTVLLAKCIDAENNKYMFETKPNNSTARTPFGAFNEMQIENDILKVIDVLKEY